MVLSLLALLRLDKVRPIIKFWLQEELLRLLIFLNDMKMEL